MHERTPGPWRVEKLNSFTIVYGPDDQVVFMVNSWLPEADQLAANVRFAATAPQLEEYLEVLESAIDEVCDDHVIAKINAVERRIRGECFSCGEQHACHACGTVHFDDTSGSQCPVSTHPDCNLRPAT